MLRFLRDERGATAIEYGLIAGLVAVAIVGALRVFSTQTIALYALISSTISSAVSGS